MLPSFSSGDFVLIFKYPYTTFLPGDVVVIRHPHLETIIKRIKSITINGGFTLVGDNLIASSSSDTMGEVESSNILGKVILHIPKPQTSRPAK